MHLIRVVYLSDARYEGGAERYLLRLAGGLDRHSFTPVLALPRIATLDRLAQAAEEAGIEVHRHEDGGFAGARSAAALLAILKRLRPQIVHLNLPSTYDLACNMAALVARVAGAPAIVSTEHIADILPSRRRVLMKRVALAAIDRVITISEMHRELLVGRHGVPARLIRVILNGVEDPGTPLPRPPGAFEVLCVGVLEARKGQELLVEALASVRQAGVDMKLTLVGQGPDRERLEERVRERGLAPHVRFTGRLDSAWPEYRVARVVAIPSRIEGLPFAAIEGMAAGAVVVASALPGMGEVIDPDRTGLLLPPDDAPAWADCLTRLARDPELCDRLAREGRREYELRFTRERMVRDTEHLYREVLG